MKLAARHPNNIEAMRGMMSLFCAAVALIAGGCASDFKPKQAADIVLREAHISGSAVAFNPDSSVLASAGYEGDIQLVAVPGGKILTRFRAHRDAVFGMAFVDAARLISAGYDGRMVEWDSSGRLLREIATPSPISHMVLDSQRQQILTGHRDGAVRVWRLADLTMLEEQRPHRGEVRAVAWHGDSGRMASSGHDGRVFVWTRGNPPIEMQSAGSDAAHLQFSPDGTTLMGGAWFKLLSWNVATATLSIIPTEHHGLINSLRYTSDGKAVATISRHTDSAVYFLDAQNGAVVRRFQAHDLCGADIAISPNGRFLATTSDDNSVRLWDLSAAPAR